MTTVIAYAFLWALLLTMSIAGIVRAVDVSSALGSTFQEASELREIRQKTRISIQQVAFFAADTYINVQVDNKGSTSVKLGEDTDVIIYYQPLLASNYEPKRLSYVSSLPTSDEWALAGLSPDKLNPGLWDPGEQATFELHPNPWVTSGTVVAITIGTPGGVSDTTSAQAP